MLTDRLRKAIDRAAELPETSQDAVAVVLEQVLEQVLAAYEQRPPELRPDLSAIVEQSMRDHAATLEYLKDK